MLLWVTCLKVATKKPTLDSSTPRTLPCAGSSDRATTRSIDDPRIDRGAFLRPPEIPSYLERGLFASFITGFYLDTETRLTSSRSGRASSTPADLQPGPGRPRVPDAALAVVPTCVGQSGSRTEFPSLTALFSPPRRQGDGRPVLRRDEAKVPDHRRRDRRPDETGSFLPRTGLRIRTRCGRSYNRARQPAEPPTPTPQAGRDEDLARLLRGSIRPAAMACFRSTWPADKLAAVTAMLPAMASPTVTALSTSGLTLSDTVVAQARGHTLIPEHSMRAGRARHPGDPDLVRSLSRTFFFPARP